MFINNQFKSKYPCIDRMDRNLIRDFQLQFIFLQFQLMSPFFNEVLRRSN